MNLLILGGYGTFGGRLALLLADTPGLTLVLAGRSLAQATAFCARLQGAATVTPAVFDRNGDVAAQLATLAPDAVVDATGPFQHYGDDPYAVVRACIAQGRHYLDLADGSDFVAGVARFDAEARARGVFVLSGVSSFPVLTAAVVRLLSADMESVESVTGGIAPSPYAGVGVNVIRAIAGYAGKPLRLRRGGRWTQGHAFTETVMATVAPPGALPLHSIRFSLVDVPDLQALPALWPALRTVWMGAGPVPALLHAMLRGLAWLVRLRLLPSLLPFARLFHWVINVAVWGEHRGGMFVRLRGRDREGHARERTWHLLAEGDDGPLIPSMAVEALVRRCLAGQWPAPGARAATRELEMADYEQLFAGRQIVTGIREDAVALAGAPLYAQVLGTAWAQLPAPLRTVHGAAGSGTVAGTADIERGAHPLARLVAALFRFPAAGQAVPLRVTFHRDAEGETWERQFGPVPGPGPGRADRPQRMRSRQSAGRGRREHLLVERFGPASFAIALVWRDGQLQLVLRGWSLLGLPLPLWLAPRVRSFETVRDGRFGFFVEIMHPLCGLIVRYQGTLA